MLDFRRTWSGMLPPNFSYIRKYIFPLLSFDSGALRPSASCTASHLMNGDKVFVILVGPQTDDLHPSSSLWQFVGESLMIVRILADSL